MFLHYTTKHSYHWYIKLPNVSPILFLKIFFAVMTKPLNFCDSSVDPRVTIKKNMYSIFNLMQISIYITNVWVDLNFQTRLNMVLLNDWFIYKNLPRWYASFRRINAASSIFYEIIFFIAVTGSIHKYLYILPRSLKLKRSGII